MLIAMLVFKIPRVYFTYEVLITRNLGNSDALFMCSEFWKPRCFALREGNLIKTVPCQHVSGYLLF